jgi:hypothetical protein
VDQDQPDKHMEEREAEKIVDLESLADALAAFRQLHRDLDQWERVHLARGLAAVLSGCYGAGAIEAAIALTPEIERSPKAKLPTDPFYERFALAVFERALDDIWAEPRPRPFHRAGSAAGPHARYGCDQCGDSASGQLAGTSVCNTTSGGQLKRAFTTQVPTPFEV